MAEPNPNDIGLLSLTLGELTAIWELTDWEIPEIGAAFANGSGSGNPAFLLALQLIAGTRLDPNYSLTDAGAVRLVDLPEGPTDAES